MTTTERVKTCIQKCGQNDPAALKELLHLLSEIDERLASGSAASADDALRRVRNQLAILAKQEGIAARRKPQRHRLHHNSDVLLIRPNGCVLLAHRDSAKFLFGGAKTLPFREHKRCDRTRLAASLNGFFGVSFHPNQLKRVGGPQTASLGAKAFVASTETEGLNLQNAVTRVERPATVQWEWNSFNRMLTVLSTANGTQGDLDRVCDAIAAGTGLQPSIRLARRESNRLFVCILSREQADAIEGWMQMQESIRASARRTLKDGFVAGEAGGLLAQMQADSWSWEHWTDVTSIYRDGAGFANDICDGYLGNPAIIGGVGRVFAQASPAIVALHDGAAKIRELAGGKGTHLAYLADRIPEAEASVPGGFAINAEYLHDRLRRDRAVSELFARNASPSEIRDAIMRLRLPASFRRSLDDCFREIGAPSVAVRSSSPGEDHRSQSGAGMGESFLAVSRQNLPDAVLRVLASCYSDNFAAYRQLHPGTPARMAVLLQPMVDAEVAGVAFSVDAPGSRPGTRITLARIEAGKPLIVNSGEGESYLASPCCKMVLEEQIPDEAQTGLSVEHILHVARTVQGIRERFRRRGLADEVDVEFAFSADLSLTVLQARPLTSAVFDKSQSLIRTVALSGNAKVAMRHFSAAVIGNTGVATGILQLVEHPSDFASVVPGAIVITYSTNNQWNAVLGRCAAVICETGTICSHTAVFGREIGIPALVAAADAMAALREFQGQMVTLDAGLRAVYLGALPVIEVERGFEVFLSRESSVAKVAELELQARARAFMTPVQRLQPYGQVMQWAGLWYLGKPRIRYSYFQLDYYDRAWGALPGWLSEVFPHRPAIRSGVPREIIDRVMAVPIESCVACLSELMGSLDLDDLEILVRRRSELFAECEAFMAGLERIDSSNVAAVNRWLVRALMQLHSAVHVWFHLTHRFLKYQSAHLTEELQPQLMELALRRSGSLDRAGRLNLFREKRLAMAAIAADINLSEAAQRSFNQDSVVLVRHDLGRDCPEILSAIMALSTRFKNGTEDLRLSSDLDQYLVDFREIVRSGKKTSLEDIFSYASDRMDKDRPPQDWWEDERSRQSELASTIAHYAHTTGAEPSDVCRRIQDHQSALEARLVPILEQYPRMLQTLRVAAHEALLRDNGHHLITRWQRKVARLMREAAKRACPAGWLPSPESVFDLSMVEFETLLMAARPLPYLLRSLERRQMQEEAQRLLDRAWRAAHADGKAWVGTWEKAIAIYCREIGHLTKLLDEQARAASTDGFDELAAYYVSESNRLHAHSTARQIREKADGRSYPDAA